MSHELDLGSIETIIRRAKQERAKHMATFGPALRGLGSVALLAILMPWHLVRQTLNGMFS